MGANYCVADIYLFVVTGWFGRLQIPLKMATSRFREVVATRLQCKQRD